MGIGRKAEPVLLCQDIRVVVNLEEWVPERAWVLQSPLVTAKQAGAQGTRVLFGVNAIVLPGRWEASPVVRCPQEGPVCSLLLLSVS